MSPVQASLEKNEDLFGRRQMCLPRIAANKQTRYLQVGFQKRLHVSLNQLCLEMLFSMMRL